MRAERLLTVLPRCKHSNTQSGSLGLVVMGGDSCSKGRGFKSGTIYYMDIFPIYLLLNLS